MANEYDLYGDWPNYFHKKLKEDWALSPTCRENCECYFLRHWESTWFFDNVQSESDDLPYNGTVYKMICIPDFQTLMGFNQVQLSFRKPLAELNLPAYVLVKGIENKS